MPVAGVPYLKKSERSVVLTAVQLTTSKQAVNSCRHCHYQPSTKGTDELPPKSVKYPKGSEPLEAVGVTVLTNDSAYHIRCISCHEAAAKRDPKLKAPKGCKDCHVKKT